LVLFTVILSVVSGTLLSAVLAILPGLHVYNILGLVMLLVYGAPNAGLSVGPETFLPFAIGLVCGWAMLNTIPSVLLGAPG